MEELKLLIEMVASLPAMAMWVLVGFWAYKVVVVGSVYGVIRFVAQKVHDMYVNRYKVVDGYVTLDNLTITGHLDELVDALSLVRKRGKVLGRGTVSNFIHESDIEFIREAIKEKIKSEEK